jgi:predicted dinucleotide-binding enzyme
MAKPEYPDGRLAMFYCGDDAEAKSVAENLIRETGFEAYDLGPLTNAPLMEAQARLWVWLAYSGGLSANFGFRLIRR